MKISKKILSITVSAATISFMSITSFASVTYNGPIAQIVRSHVDSNTYTTIASPTKASDASTCSLRVTNLYKSDGTGSNYKKIKAKFYVGSTICTTSTEYTSADLGKYLTPTLKEQYRKKGTTLTFKAMGNDPSLDCQMTGFFTAN